MPLGVPVVNNLIPANRNAPSRNIGGHTTMLTPYTSATGRSGSWLDNLPTLFRGGNQPGPGSQAVGASYQNWLKQHPNTVNPVGTRTIGTQVGTSAGFGSANAAENDLRKQQMAQWNAVLAGQQQAAQEAMAQQVALQQAIMGYQHGGALANIQQQLAQQNYDFQQGNNRTQYEFNRQLANSVMQQLQANSMIRQIEAQGIPLTRELLNEGRYQDVDLAYEKLRTEYERVYGDRDIARAQYDQDIAYTQQQHQQAIAERNADVDFARSLRDLSARERDELFSYLAQQQGFAGEKFNQAKAEFAAQFDRGNRQARNSAAGRGAVFTSGYEQDKADLRGAHERAVSEADLGFRDTTAAIGAQRQQGQLNYDQAANSIANDIAETERAYLAAHAALQNEATTRYNNWNQYENEFRATKGNLDTSWKGVGSVSKQYNTKNKQLDYEQQMAQYRIDLAAWEQDQARIQAEADAAEYQAQQQWAAQQWAAEQAQWAEQQRMNQAQQAAAQAEAARMAQIQQQAAANARRVAGGRQPRFGGGTGR